ncbi:MAG: response regulator, partial [Deltaproteobacteria bacterium]
FNSIKNNLNTCIDAVNNLVADAKVLSVAAVEGRLGTRADASKHSGDYRKIVDGVNKTLDAVINPLNVAATYVDAIARGNIPAKITDSYNGDFNSIKNNLNTCIDAVNNLVADAKVLSVAAVEGRLGTRADASKHSGDYRKIVDGVNKTLDAVINPLNVAATYVDAIARGNIPAKITDSYNGDFNSIKNNLNTCIDAVNNLVTDADMLSVAGVEGRLTARADASRHGGDFRKIVDGVNRTLDSVINPLNVAASHIDSMSKGNFPGMITDRYNGDFGVLTNNLNSLSMSLKGAAGHANLVASGNYEADIAPRSERDELGIALQKMTRSLRDAARDAKETNWLKTGLAVVNDLVLGKSDVQSIASTTTSVVARHLDAKVAAMYTLDHDSEGPLLKLVGTYAFSQRKNLSSRFRIGEGLVGQAALEKSQIVIENAPEDYVRVVSGLGDAVPRNICVSPILFKSELRGVMEFGTLAPLTPVQQQYVEQVAAVLGVSLEIAYGQSALRNQQDQLRSSNEELQEQTRALEHSGQELQAQQAELEQSNAELQVQMQRTKESEGRLKVQQKSLAITNEELEGRNEELERQKTEMESARRDIAIQAEELAIASKYKSEFLANMSHELRTPLNSLLLLARSLRDNAEGNLTDDQKESASVIFAGGNDLLNLINEILDLSKIEAGRMDLRLETVEVADLTQTILRQFDHMARSQGLTLAVNIAPGVPSRIVTDPHRLGQVLKNLVGNALKFTERGSVTLTLARPEADEVMSRPGLSASSTLAMRVTDTGIGIPIDKQRIVFEAFQQADSGDRRKYGGTGLGLSISRELVTLLGGELHLKSEPGVGSTFSVIIPVMEAPTETRAVQRSEPASTSLRQTAVFTTPPPGPAPASPKQETEHRGIADDRDLIDEGTRAILIIEDDERFVAVLMTEVRRRGFKCLAALTGKDGLSLAKSFRPSGVILDINLPDTNGWAVLASLKQDVDTRHIPVHIVSAEETSLEGLRNGAIGHANKPLRAEDVDAILATIEGASASAEKLVLVVEDDPVMRSETVRIIGNGTVHVQEVGTGAEALVALKQRRFDLVVLDLGLPDMQGLDLLSREAARPA